MINRLTLSLFLMLMLLFSTIRAAAQQDSTAFDLVIFGQSLDAEAVTVELKTNPRYGSEWIRLKSQPYEITDLQINNGYALLLISGMERERYIGQDIRENHLTIKITSNTNAPPARVHAVYAFPLIREIELNKRAELIAKLIVESPTDANRYRLARHVRPRPFTIETGQAFIEHIEVPVRHLKPGIQEVKWLDILTSGN